MKDIFPESLGQKCGCALYIGVHYTQQNMVHTYTKIQSGVGSKNFSAFTQWNTMQQKERRSPYPLQLHGWNWRVYAK